MKVHVLAYKMQCPRVRAFATKRNFLIKTTLNFEAIYFRGVLCLHRAKGGCTPTINNTSQ